MKKLILAIAATSVVAFSGHAQQLLFTDAGVNSTDTSIDGIANTHDLNLQLLIGSTSGTVTTDVVTLLLNATSSPTTALGSTQSGVGDITTSGGDIYDPTGSAYSVPAGTAWAEVLAWTGSASSYAAASVTPGDAVGSSGVFAIIPAPANGSAPSDISNIETLAGGGINLVTVATPEPSTLAMAGVGLASMLIFRRKSK
jgi:hypothetical protein